LIAQDTNGSGVTTEHIFGKSIDLVHLHLHTIYSIM
jgi:hypothetical protein